MSDKVRLRGTFDGIKIYIEKNASVADAAAELNEKLQAQRKFFGDAECYVYIISREPLTVSDRVRLEAVISAHMPKCMVRYGEPIFTPPKREQIHQKTVFDSTDDVSGDKSQPLQKDDMESEPSAEQESLSEASPEVLPDPKTDVAPDVEPDKSCELPSGEEDTSPTGEEETELSPIERILQKWDDERNAARKNADRIVQKWDDEYRSAHTKTERIVEKWDRERETKKKSDKKSD